MRLALIAIAVVTFAGCTASFETTPVTAPSGELSRERPVVIATPVDGSFRTKEYTKSGEMTARAVQAAFARYTNKISVEADCADFTCLKSSAGADQAYLVVPEIIHWEDRTTQLSGVSDKLEIKLSIYDGATGQDVASAFIRGKSKLLTFGGDRTEDLLKEPIFAYVSSLYR